MKFQVVLTVALMILTTGTSAFADSPTDFSEAIHQTKVRRENLRKEFLRLVDENEPASDDDVSIKTMPAQPSRGIASVGEAKVVGQ